MKTKAVTMEEPGEFDIVEVELPEIGPNDVLVRVEANGVCGTDIHIAEGGMDLDFPILPGHEFVGHVEKKGENVDTDARGRTLEEGDPITGVPFWKVEEDWYSKNMPTREVLFTGVTGLGLAPLETGDVGGMSQYLVLPEETETFRLPDDMDVRVGALSEPTSIGVHAYELAKMPGMPNVREGVGIGSSVAVQGAGPIGLLTMVAADVSGSGQIIAIDAMEERLELAREFGATDTIDVTDYDDDEAMIKDVKDITEGAPGPDAVIEATGVPETVRQAIEIPHDGGIFVEAGHYAYSGDVEINPTRIVQKELQIRGSKAAPPREFQTAVELLEDERDEYPFEKLAPPREFQTAVELLEDERDEYPFEKLLNYPVPMEDVEDAYETQAEGGALRATIHPHGI